MYRALSSLIKRTLISMSKPCITTNLLVLLHALVLGCVSAQLLAQDTTVVEINSVNETERLNKIVDALDKKIAHDKVF